MRTLAKSVPDIRFEDVTWLANVRHVCLLDSFFTDHVLIAVVVSKDDAAILKPR